MRKWLWVLPCIAAGLALCCASADPPKVEKMDGHVVPLMTEIAFKDKNVANARVMVCAVLAGGHHNRYASHFWNLTGAGDVTVRIWLDTIAELKDIDDQRLTVVFKDGTERDFRHGQEALRVYQPNDAWEKVLVTKLKHVRFLHPPRKDQQNQAMFDHWRYSPYTGEKLPISEGQ